METTCKLLALHDVAFIVSFLEAIEISFPFEIDRIDFIE